MKKVVMLFLIFLLAAPTFLFLQPIQAQTEPTLAEQINNSLKTLNIASYTSSFGTLYSQIFGLTNQSIFDAAISQTINQQNYAEAIFIFRLAELSHYTSQTLNSSIIIALQNMPMCGALPLTSKDKIIVDGVTEANESFLLYDRYLINGYRYAQWFNIPRWNAAQAFQEYAYQYLRPPKYSHYGEMLNINPAINYSISLNSRYYDDHAETLSTFLEFAALGINESLNYADDTWYYTQSHWTGTFYEYIDNTSIVECEMGSFAQVATQYQNFRGQTQYSSRITEDLKNKLLYYGFDSAGWGTIGVIKHADSNPQLRLYETTAALIALQMLYPEFDKEAQQQIKSLITSDSWRGLINSALSSDNKFRFFDVDGNNNACNYEDDAIMLGTMALFLYGITPETGHLLIDASNERYQDQRTCFPVTQWQFNYQNRSIRIPVSTGNLTFAFGTQKVSQNFITAGVYDIQFDSGWNTVTKVTKATDLSENPLPRIEIQPLPRANPYPVLPVRNSTYIPNTKVPRENNQNTSEMPDSSTTQTITPEPIPTNSPSTPTLKPKSNDNSTIPTVTPKPSDIQWLIPACFAIIIVIVFANIAFFARRGKKLS